MKKSSKTLVPNLKLSDTNYMNYSCLCTQVENVSYKLGVFGNNIFCLAVNVSASESQVHSGLLGTFHRSCCSSADLDAGL